MSLFRIRESEEAKQTKFVNHVSLKQARSSNGAYSTSPALNSTKKLRRTTDSTKQGDTPCTFPEIASRLAITGSSQMGDGKLPMWHYLMEQTFESFLLRLDDVFLCLRRDITKDNAITYSDIASYQDICEKLRTEILIAMDRLELLAMPKTDVCDTKTEFINKLNGIKRQLSDLRWQYHNAIKDVGAKII